MVVMQQEKTFLPTPGSATNKASPLIATVTTRGMIVWSTSAQIYTGLTIYNKNINSSATQNIKL